MLLGVEFREAVASADAVIEAASDQGVYREGGWTRKEILGHLIDSAAHNHVRFVTAANRGSLQVESYDQQRCVALHGYAEMTWDALVAQWRSHNELIARVVERIPAAALECACALHDGSTITLEGLIRDYLRHLAHHVAQISDARS